VLFYGAEGAAKTLRQKDQFRTKLWRALQQRTNEAIRIKAENLSGQ
jgi:hypothetical protein